MLAELTKPQTVFKVDVANDMPAASDAVSTTRELMINVPQHVQPSLDKILDYYTENSKKPIIKLCGNPLEIVCDFITQIEASLPENLLSNGRDVIDFMIHNLCEFCREKNVNHLTFNFVFHRDSQVQ